MRKLLLILMALSALMIVPVMAQEATPASTDGMAFVRFAHFSPGAPAVDLYMNGEASDFTNVEFRGFSNWMAIEPGTYSLTVTPTGTSASDAVIEPVDANLAAGTWTTLAVAGSMDDGSLSIQPIDQTWNRAEMLPGTSFVTYLNAVPGGANVDVVRNDSVYTPNLFPLGKVDGGASWFGVADDVDTYNFRFVETGTADNVLLELLEQKLLENEIYLLALVGTPDDLEVIVDNTSMAEIAIARGELEAPGTIIEVLSADDGLAPLVDLIDQADLTATLSGEGPYTFFVPADFLLDNIPAEITGDDDALRNFLEGHIVEGDFRSADVFNAGTLTALNGQTLTIDAGGETGFINGSQIIDVNMTATNGVIHIINPAFMPATEG